MKNQIFDFNSIATGKPVKAIQQAFARAGVPVISIDADGKAKHTAGVSYKALTLTFADSQKVELAIKQSGDVYRVSLNGSVVPLKNPDDHAKAVGEIAKMLDAGRAKFQAKMARTKVDLPKGIKTAAPKMEQQLAAQIQELDTKIAELRATLEELKAAKPVMDAAGDWFSAMRRSPLIAQIGKAKADHVIAVGQAKGGGDKYRAAARDAYKEIPQHLVKKAVALLAESGAVGAGEKASPQINALQTLTANAASEVIKDEWDESLTFAGGDAEYDFWMKSLKAAKPVMDAAQHEGDGEVGEPKQDDDKQGKLFAKKADDEPEADDKPAEGEPEGNDKADDDDDTEQAMDAVSGYKINHQTFSAACAEAIRVAESRGFTVDDDDWFSQVSTGPRKPQPGATNKYLISLLKDGKETKKALAFQVYGRENGDYELNCYIG